MPSSSLVKTETRTHSDFFLFCLTKQEMHYGSLFSFGINKRFFLNMCAFFYQNIWLHFFHQLYVYWVYLDRKSGDRKALMSISDDRIFRTNISSLHFRSLSMPPTMCFSSSNKPFSISCISIFSCFTMWTAVLHF